MEENSSEFSEMSRNEIIIKYLHNLRLIKSEAEINYHINPLKFDKCLLLKYFQNSNNDSTNNFLHHHHHHHHENNNFSLIYDEILKRFMCTRRKILIWIFYLIIVYLFISYKNEASTIVLRNIQTFIYPGMKLWRRFTLPIISSFPFLTELYDESCLLMNPLFRVNDLNCKPCTDIVNVLDLTHLTNTAEKTEFVPFIFKIDQNPVYISDLQNLYENEKDVFQNDAYRVKSTNYDVKNLDDLFADFNRTNQIESHNLWRFNRMQPARLLRKLLIKPRLLPTTGIALERYLSIDTPKAPTYIIPDGECSNMYIQQILGTRIIILRPTVECRHKCRTISVRLPQSFVLKYNWWYWRPVSVADQITNSRSISLIGSHC